RDLGAPMSPFNAFMFLQGLETLPLRMERHCANALRVAAWLSQHPRITSVIHPSLAEGEAARRAEAHLKGGMGSLLGFEMEGRKEAGQAFIEKLKLLYHVANIGDARSLAIHPASTTHSQLDEAALAAAGVTPGYIRLSIGIEHIDDILADLEQALA
ncbi:MAG TPA: PLP-dependent transferase, partial [Roseococcus sp.]|nr:PLP-dependent transferase [Roseococcus sp.]